jgi:hypothetical protein
MEGHGPLRNFLYARDDFWRAITKVVDANDPPAVFQQTDAGV